MFTGSKYLVEKKYNDSDTWFYVGNYNKSFEIAQAIQYSPSKTNQFLRKMDKYNSNLLRTNEDYLYRITLLER